MAQLSKPAVDEEDRIAGVVQRLSSVVGEQLARSTVEEEVRRAFAEWADAPVRDFVPILAERLARARVREAGPDPASRI